MSLVIAELRQRVTALKNASTVLIEETQELTAQLEQTRELSENLTACRQALKELIKLRLAATEPIPDQYIEGQEQEQEQQFDQFTKLDIAHLPSTLAALASVSSTTPLSLLDTILPSSDTAMTSPKTPIVHTNVQEPESSTVDISPPLAPIDSSSSSDQQDSTFAPPPPAPEFDMPGFGAPVDTPPIGAPLGSTVKFNKTPTIKIGRPPAVATATSARSTSLQEQILNRPQLKKVDRAQIDATRLGSNVAPVQLQDAVKAIIMQRSQSMKGNVQVGTILQEQVETLLNGDVKKHYVQVNKDALKPSDGHEEPRLIEPDAFDETSVWIPNVPVPYVPKKTFRFLGAGQGQTQLPTQAPTAISTPTPTPAMAKVVQRAQEKSALELKRNATTLAGAQAKASALSPSASPGSGIERKSQPDLAASQRPGVAFGNVLSPASKRSIPKPKQSSIFDSQTETDDKAAGLFAGLKTSRQFETKVVNNAAKSANTKTRDRLNTSTNTVKIGKQDEAKLVLYAETLDSVYADLGQIAGIDAEILNLSNKIRFNAQQVGSTTDYEFQMLLALERRQYDERRASLVQVRHVYAEHVQEISREIPTWLDALLKDYSPLYTALVR